MAETLISPGALTRENDLSQVTQQPVTVGAAVIGPTVKGPVEVPTLVTTYNDFVNKFGTTLVSGSDEFSFMTSITAYNYFQNGGTSLLVARVVDGTYTAATSSQIDGSGSTTDVLTLETIAEGADQNSESTEGTNASLPSGSSDNLRFEITTPDTASGTFSLLVRRGDDLSNDKVILETWTNLSLDPKADNFVSRVIGDQKETYSSSNNQVEITGAYPNNSRYIRVSSVTTTPDYFDNNGDAKAEYTSSIPTAASGTFGGATGTVAAGAKFYDEVSSSDIQGLDPADYDNMISLLANKDDYQYNILSLPGLTLQNASSQVTTAANNCKERGDAILLVDPIDYTNGTLAGAVTQASAVDNSYAAAYWPWVQIIDPATGKQVWVPAATLVSGVYAFNDSTRAAWFAPAGLNRGGLSLVTRAQFKLSSANRDTLYTGNINPIATFPNTGVVVYGQKTLQKKSTALDRVNVRRLLIELKSYIGQVANTLVFEQNTQATRNNFLAQVNPYLESVQQRQGLYAFKVQMDDTNNTADVIDRNQLVGQVFLQPTRTAEFILLDFNVLPTGATFE